MANFHTHISVAAVASGLLSSTLLVADVVSPGEATILWVLGAGGGLLPDIDSDSSRSIRWIFNSLAVLASLITLLATHSQLPLYGLWLAIAATYIAVRYGAMPLFAEWTRHRGIFHSLLALPFFTLITVYIAEQLFQQPVWLAWTAGTFICAGALVHLILDELYAVDLEGLDLKASFGTALKPFSLNNLVTSGVMGVSVAALVWFAPPIAPFLRVLERVDWARLFSVPLL